MNRASTYAKRAALGAFIFQMGLALFNHTPGSPFESSGLGLRLAGGLAMAALLAALAASIGAVVGVLVSRMKPVSFQAPGHLSPSAQSPSGASNPRPPQTLQAAWGENRETSLPSSAIEPVESNEPQEEFWSSALIEFDGPARRSGLWARAFAEARGNDSAAKALYLRYRASQLQAEHEADLAQFAASKHRAEKFSAYIAGLSDTQRQIRAAIKFVERDSPGSFRGLVALIRLLGGQAEWKQRGFLRAEWVVEFDGLSHSFKHNELFELWAMETVLPFAKSSVPKPPSGVLDEA